MGRNLEEKDMMNEKLKDIIKGELEEFPSGSSPKSSNKDGRPTSMVMKANTMFPAHLIAEAISSLRGLDLRWSDPITPSEMLYVQYVFAKYPTKNASNKESRVISAPETWLDLRIKGSQLRQYFRRKCKHSPKGLFFYP